MTRRVARGTVAVLVIAIIAIAVAALAVFAWDQLRVDAMLSAQSAVNQVLAFCVAVLCVVVLNLASGLSGRRVVLLAAALIGLGLLLTTAILSGNTVALAVAFALLVCAWQIGAWVLALLDCPEAGHGLVALALGYALLMTAVFVVGVVGLLMWWFVAVPILFVGTIGTVNLAKRARTLGITPRSLLLTAGTRVSQVEAIVISIALLVVGIVSIWTAAPESQFDPLWGKEWLPAAWADAGRIAVDPRDAQTFAGGGTLYVTVVGHIIGADAVGRYLALLTGAALAVFAWRIVRPVAGSVVAACLGLIFLVAPHVVWQMGTANDDLQLCLAAGALALAVVHFTKGSWSEALTIGVLAGGVVSGKLHLLPFAAIALLGWFALAGRRGGIRSLGGVAGGAALVVAPWFAYRWIESGNPVFPGLNNVFQSRWWPPVNESFNLPYETTGALSDFLRLPVTVFIEPTRFMEAVPRGAFGLLPLALLGFLLVGWMQGPSGRRVVWAASLVAVLAWWMQLRYLRYLLPYSYVAILFAGAPVAALRAWSPAPLRRWRQPLLVTGISLVVMAGAATAASTFFTIPERVPVRAAFGRESAADYRVRLMPGVSAVSAINRLTPPGSRVVVDGGVIYQRSLTKEARTLLPAWEMNGLLAWLRDSGQAEYGPADPRAWHALGIDWVAIGVGAFDQRPVVGPLGGVIAKSGEPVWTNGSTALYRIIRR